MWSKIQNKRGYSRLYKLRSTLVQALTMQIIKQPHFKIYMHYTVQLYCDLSQLEGSKGGGPHRKVKCWGFNDFDYQTNIHKYCYQTNKLNK